MLVEKEFKKIFKQLTEEDPIFLIYEGSPLFIQLIDQSSKLLITASVYKGDNYIPFSVRKCLSCKLLHVSSPVATFLTVNELNYEVNLNYLGKASSLDYFHFKEIVDELSYLAEKWRNYLDEHDKHDLIYARSPK